LDQTAIKPFYLIDELSLYPELLPVRYPKAGEANSEVRIGVVEVSSGRTRWMDLGVESDIYVARMGFAGRDEVWFTRLNRHQNRMDLLVADAETGVSRVITSDVDDAWVDNNAPTWIRNGRQFLIESERDGHNQVYLYNRDGTLIRKLTTEPWDVTALYGVDEADEVLYFSGAGEGPLKRPLYRIGLDGEDLTRVSTASGSHAVQFNTDYSLYVDTYSTVGLPPTQTLHTTDGQVVRVIADNQELRERVRALSLAVPEFITLPVADGVELNGYVIRPPDFDPARQYPLLMYVYGGPGSQTVRDSWGGTRYLWHQLLANDGYLIASVDNRGTGARGRDFKKMTYLNLGKYEAADQIAAARYFASLPFVDETRVGIWGWSYGGYMSLMSMFTGGGAFKAALSVAPVTDWRLYDTIYTERYMRTPEENQNGYRYGSPLTFVDGLEGSLLVVHGTGDDNVHAQNTTQLIDALESAGKQFDMRLYPNKTHSIAGRQTRVNLYGLFTEWLKRNL
jgi:dipeptidyl-peptidase-4